MKKLNVLIMTLVMIGTIFTISPADLQGKASGALDINYIESKTENLSNIIFNYPDHGLDKGRAFGTEGEHAAAKDYLAVWMSDLGLNNPGLDPSYLEPIKKINSVNNLDSKLEVISKSLKINNNPIEDSEFFISPGWGETDLTRNLSGENLIVKPVPDFQVFDTFYLVAMPVIEILAKYNFESIMAKILQIFETYFDFQIEKLDPYNTSTYPTYYNETCWNEDFVYYEEDPGSNLSARPSYLNGKPPLSFSVVFYNYVKLRLQLTIWKWLQPKCQGLIRYDHYDDVHNTVVNGKMPLPVIYISGSDGDKITDNCTIDFYINQKYNDEVESYNVIGEINGTDTSKTIIISSLYDSLWTQGTADSAIGMSIVLAIAKYFKELEEDSIKPKYNIRFIAFGGEEYGFLGAKYHEYTHKDKSIKMIIDLNQLGFIEPTGPLTLNIATNNKGLKNQLNQIAAMSNYADRSGNSFATWKSDYGAPSNDHPFAKSHYQSCDTLCFLKDGGWTLHHRDGNNHNAGDIFGYYDDNDTNLTAELVWNVTKFFTINPDCWFDGVPTVNVSDCDTDQNDIPDSVNVTFTIETSMPCDRVKVIGSLKHLGIRRVPIPQVIKEYTIHDTSKITDTFTFNPPKSAPFGLYKLDLELYNSTGIVKTQCSFLSKYYDDYYCKYLDLGSPNDPPDTPSKPTECDSVSKREFTLCTNTTDPNDDQIYYQWCYKYKDSGDDKGDQTYSTDQNYFFVPATVALGSHDSAKSIVVSWKADDSRDPGELISVEDFYYMWDGPYKSGETASKHFSFTKKGDYEIMVRAKDEHNLMSDWSTPCDKTINENDVDYTPVVEGEEYHYPATTVQVLPEESIDFFGKTYGINIQEDGYSLKYNTSDGYEYEDEQNITHNFTETGDYNVTFTVYNETNDYNYSMDFEIVYALADCNVSDTFIQTNETINFNDTSRVVSEYEIVNWTWDFDDGNVSYEQNLSHIYIQDGIYNVTLTVTDNQSHNDTRYQYVYVDTTPPQVMPMPYLPSNLELGQNVTIYVDVFDNISKVQTVKLNITNPNGICYNLTMNESNHTCYDYELIFTNVWQTGIYNFTLWLMDNAGNSNTSGVTSYDFIINSLFGSPYIGYRNQTIQDRITGSVFQIHEKEITEYIEAYIYANTSDSDCKTKCMIHRVNDSQLIAVTEEISNNQIENYSWMRFNFTGNPPVFQEDTEYILSCWSNDSSCMISYYNSTDNSSFYMNETYGSPPSLFNLTNNESRVYSIQCSYKPQAEISNITDTAASGTVGFGFNVNITATIVNEYNDVEDVYVNVLGPDNLSWNNTMVNSVNDSYYFNFSDTWKVGQYNYSITSVDRNYIETVSDQNSFIVSANATITICTLKDSYGSNETINLTDPPGEDEGEGGSGLTLISRGRSWNKYYNETTNNYVGSFYCNPINYLNETGIYQPINNTIIVLPQDHPARQYGYIAGCEKNVMNVYFKRWSNSTFPVCFAYNKSENTTVHTLRSKLLRVGYVDPSSNYDMATVQNVQSVQGEIIGDYGVYPGVFTGTNVTWTMQNGRLKEEIIVTQDAYDAISNHPPSSFGLSNQNSWLVWVTRLDYTGLSPELNVVKQGGNFTTNISDDRILFKNAADQIMCSFPVGIAYEQGNMSNSTRLRYRVIQYNGEYYLLAGGPVSWFNNASYPVVIDPSSDFESGTGDGYVERDDYSQTWSQVRDASTGTSSGTGDTTFYTRAYLYDFSTRLIRRVFLPFDTSSINGGTVTDATLYCRGWGPRRGSICAMKWNEGQAVSTADYNGFTGSVWDSIAYNTWNTMGWNTFDIPNNQIDTGDGDGYTDICLRNYDKDVGDSSPGPGIIAHMTYLYSADGTYPPYLNITWTAIYAPTMSTNAATSVSASSATMGGSVDDTGGDNPTRYIDWDDDSSGTPYTYQENKGDGGIGSFTHTESGTLTPGTMHWYRARGVNNGGTGLGSELMFLTAPNALSVFTATVNGSNQIDLSWTHGTGGDKVYLEYAIGSEQSPWNKGSGTIVPGGSSGVFTGTCTSHTGLDFGATYYYKAWPIASDDGQDSNGSTTKPYGVTSTGNSTTINGAPVISNPYPVNESIGVMLQPTVSVVVNDTEGDEFNITWYNKVNDSWVVFGTNNSVGNGTYYQVFSNASVNGAWWYWKVNASDGNSSTESNVFMFYTGVQSKIVNTGSYDISGYLWIFIQYYNETSGNWTYDFNVVDENNLVVINSSEEFGIDTVFNGLINSDYLSYGNGTYRILAGLYDPYGYVLVCDDDTELVATYEFEVQ